MTAKAHKLEEVALRAQLDEVEEDIAAAQEEVGLLAEWEEVSRTPSPLDAETEANNAQSSTAQPSHAPWSFVDADGVVDCDPATPQGTETPKYPQPDFLGNTEPVVMAAYPQPSDSSPDASLPEPLEQGTTVASYPIPGYPGPSSPKSAAPRYPMPGYPGPSEPDSGQYPMPGYPGPSSPKHSTTGYPASEYPEPGYPMPGYPGPSTPKRSDCAGYPMPGYPGPATPKSASGGSGRQKEAGFFLPGFPGPSQPDVSGPWPGGAKVAVARPFRPLARPVSSVTGAAAPSRLRVKLSPHRALMARPTRTGVAPPKSRSYVNMRHLYFKPVSPKKPSAPMFNFGAFAAAPAPAPATTTSHGRGIWKCAVCTLDNKDPHATQCELCNSARQ